MTQVNLSMREVWKRLCPKCKDKLAELIQADITKSAIVTALEEPEKTKGK